MKTGILSSHGQTKHTDRKARTENASLIYSTVGAAELESSTASGDVDCEAKVTRKNAEAVVSKSSRVDKSMLN